QVIERVGVGVGARLYGIVDGDRRSVVQLDLAGGDDDIAFLESAHDGDLVAPRRARRDEDLAGPQAGKSARVAARRFDDVDRVAIGREGNSGLRQGDVALRRARDDVDGREHAGQQLAARILQRGANLDVAGRGIDE